MLEWLLKRWSYGPLGLLLEFDLGKSFPDGKSIAYILFQEKFMVSAVMDPRPDNLMVKNIPQITFQ